MNGCNYAVEILAGELSTAYNLPFVPVPGMVFLLEDGAKVKFVSVVYDVSMRFFRVHGELVEA